MAQAIAESIFDICYLVGVIAAGVVMLRKGSGQVRLFGLAALVLGVGDSFHLLPRIYALWTTGLEANAAALGIGKLVTSITMTAFYMLVYYIWRQRYAAATPRIDLFMWGMAALRVVLCLLPGNQWRSANPPLLYGILRNIPFTAMGVGIIMLYSKQVKAHRDAYFRHLPLAVGLSFAFYIPVVLFSASVPLLGMLMIPKTIAYAWVVSMGWRLYKSNTAIITKRRLA